MLDEKGSPKDVAPGSGHVVRIPVDTSMLDNRALLLKQIPAPIHS